MNARPCHVCGSPATHLTGVGNDRAQRQWLCVEHAQEREVLAAVWCRSIVDLPTTRERKEARADRLREWADKREAKATADLERAHTMADAIPFGQPILAGHYSEGRDRNYRTRIASTMNRGVGHAKKAEEFDRRANGIDSQLERSIYSDDIDAIEKLKERISELEAERARIKAYNDSCRKAAKSGGTGDLSILTAAERDDLVSLARYAAFQLKPGNAFPAYKLSNLSGNIKRNRDRLATLKAQREAVDRHRRLHNEQVERDEDDHGPGCDGPYNCVCKNVR